MILLAAAGLCHEVFLLAASTNWAPMEILALQVSLTEADVNGLIAPHLGQDQSVRELQVRLTEQGVHVAGAYALSFFTVHFDTRWVLSVSNHEVAAQLADLRVAGARGGLVRSTLLEMLAANLEHEGGLRVENDTILLDPDAVLARLGLAARTNLKAVQCQTGRVIIRGGTHESEGFAHQAGPP